MTNYLTTAQLVGYFAFALNALVFWQKNDRKFLLINAIAACVWGIHYALLSAWVGAALDVLVALRSYLSSRGMKLHHRPWNVAVFGSAFLAIGAVTYRQPIDILPTAACLLATMTTIYWHSFRLRYSMLLVIMLWLIYNYTSNSIGGTLCSTTMLGVQIITLVRMYADRRRDARTNPHPLP